MKNVFSHQCQTLIWILIELISDVYPLGWDCQFGNTVGRQQPGCCCQNSGDDFGLRRNPAPSSCLPSGHWRVFLPRLKVEAKCLCKKQKKHTSEDPCPVATGEIQPAYVRSGVLLLLYNWIHPHFLHYHLVCCSVDMWWLAAICLLSTTCTTLRWTQNITADPFHPRHKLPESLQSGRRLLTSTAQDVSVCL